MADARKRLEVFMRGRWPFSLVVVALVLAQSPIVAAAGPCKTSVGAARSAKPCEVAAPVPQYPHPRGLPQLIVGTSLFLFGLPAVFSSLQFLYPDPTGGDRSAEQDRRAYNMLIPGVVMIGIGIPLAIVGAVRFERFLRWRRGTWQARHQLTPLASRTPGGGVAAGVGFRF